MSKHQTPDAVRITALPSSLLEKLQGLRRWQFLVAARYPNCLLDEFCVASASKCKKVDHALLVALLLMSQMEQVLVDLPIG